MVDFLRSNNWCTREDYMWHMTVGQIRLSLFDFSHIEYKSDKIKKKKGMTAGDWLMRQGIDNKNTNDLGQKIIKE